MHLVSRAELQLVIAGTVSNNNLTRVLVRHHNGRDRQSRALGIGVVSAERLCGHACMVMLSLLIGRSKFKNNESDWLLNFTWTRK